MGKIIDTHCHPFLNKLKDPQSIIESFFKNDGEALIIIGTDLDFFDKEIKNYIVYDNVYFSLGIHPNHIDDNGDINASISKLEEQYINIKDKVVGIGECGLDYYWLYKDVENMQLEGEEKESFVNEKKLRQKEAFIKQIELAKKFDLPIIIHNRDARDDIFEIIMETGLKNFIFHCFSEDLEFALKLIEYSPTCKISFSGIVTFYNAKNIQETAKNIPIENILVETDSPYLTPAPHRGKEENEPMYTRYVVEKIAELRGEDVKYVEAQVLKNSKEMFGIVARKYK